MRFALLRFTAIARPMQPRGIAPILMAAASVFLALMAGCRASQQVQLTVSVAASLTGTIEPLESAYRQQHPEVEFRNNFGSSGVLARQIEQGAPVDLFLSAASKPVDELIAKGIIAAGQSRILLSNHLVLIAPTNSSLSSVAQLNAVEVRRVAIGDPQSVPVGQYAMQSLQFAKLAEAIRGKLVFAKDARQVLAYVETGNADAGFVYATDAASSIAERALRVERLLRALRIAHLAARMPARISGGERQRAAIARCLAMEPEALLFDEPFAALDPHLRRSTEEQLRETLRSYRGAVLFVTHDMEEAFRFCSGLMVLDCGRTIASGPRQELFQNPGSIVAARLTGCKNIAAASRIDASHLRVEAWECTLVAPRAIGAEIAALGYRSHHFRFQQQAVGENVFPCWLMETSEAPHEMTLYLRLHKSQRPGDAYHLQADLPREAWLQLRDRPQPWSIQIVPERILLLAE